MSVSIELKQIDLSYGSTQVIKGVTLSIEPGEFFAFLGPSGCGKSTLLRLIAGFEHSQRGQVLINGEDVTALPPWERNVGMVFQNYALWPHMTVWKNVAFGLEEHKLPKAEIERRVEAALERVGLRDYAHRRPNQLSGGQQQRVALARTLAIEPKVLLLDEPLSNLDAKLRVHMRQELLALQRELDVTTIFVTHDQEEANTTSDRIAVLNDGKVQQVGAPMTLYDRPNNLFVAEFLGSANVLQGQVVDEAGHRGFISDRGLRLPLDQPTDLGNQALVFRPQNLHRCAPGADRSLFEGTVRLREFLGNIMRYDIDCQGESLLLDELYGRGLVPAEPGERVGLYIDADDLLLMNDERSGDEMQPISAGMPR